MKKCGLLGEKLSHSYSPFIHNLLCDYDYRLFEKAPEDVEDFIRNGDFDGINVTIPYKKTVFALCDELSDAAKKLGNVNTVLRLPDGRIFGHNTDYYGFKYTVTDSGISVAGKKVAVLGDGGASGTVCCVLKDLGASEVTVISLFTENNYENIHRHYDAQIIVNATPVGMYPHNGNKLIDLTKFTRCEGIFDLVYNPAKTALMLEAERLGIPHRNGLAMLVAQAKESAEYFSGEKIDDSMIGKITAKLTADMKNIILIGMPGCGKSTLGKTIAQMTGRQFIDADESIVYREQMSIPEIFAKSGEDGFRKAETEALADICKRSSYVIATGGGCVTRDENYPLLHQNGTIIWIQREIESLPTDGRPLSQSGNLEKMYEVRRPMYEKFADHIVENSGDVQDTARQILKLIEE